MASTYLSRTLSASPTNQKIITYSFWAKRSNLGIYAYNLVGNTSSPYVTIGFLNDDTFAFLVNAGAGSTGLITTAKYRDVSAWYHIVCVLDTTQATDSNRMKIYINGVQITDFGTASYPTQDSTWNINTNVEHGVGGSSVIQDFDGYMAEVYFIDGQALSPTDFGQTDSTGIWKPKGYSGSYGTNGFNLKFSNGGDLGADSSGNGNNFTKSGNGRQTTDAPSNVFATILPMANTSLSEGNLKLTTSRTGNWDGTIGSLGVKSGKWYHEVRMSNTEANFRCVAGWIGNEASQTVVLNGKGTSGDPVSSLFDNYAFLPWATFYYKDGAYNGTSPTASSGDIINIAVDFDNGKIWFGINGTYYNNSGSATGDPSAGTNESISGIDLTASEYVPFFQIRSDSSIGGNVMIPNFGQEGSFAGTETAQGNSDGNGYGDFYYAPPSGYLALCTKNLASELTLPIDDGSEYFNTVLYTGNGTNPRSLTGVGFQPDFTWIKNRTDAWGHGLADSTRGGGKTLITNSTAVEQTNYTSGYVDSFDSDGFTVDDGASGDDFVNQTSDNYVSWNWLANGGTTSSNTDGSITSTVQANTTAGFSIVTYTGNATAGATVGHGLGTTPALIILKSRSSADDWMVGHKDYVGNPAENLLLNSTSALATADDQQGSTWYRTPFTSTVFTLGDGQLGDWTGRTNGSGKSIIGYCFAPIEGYSKFGKYTGNGSTNGTFIYTGFRPAWVVSKRIDSTGDWLMRDTTRDPYNVTSLFLKANASNAEASSGDIDIVSNGFKWRSSTAGQNGSGASYIYIAFAENPFVTSGGLPVTAR